LKKVQRSEGVGGISSETTATIRYTMSEKGGSPAGKAGRERSLRTGTGGGSVTLRKEVHRSFS